MLSSFSPSRIVAALITLSPVTSLHADQWTYSGISPSTRDGSQELLNQLPLKEVQYINSSAIVAKLHDDTLLAWGTNSYSVLNIPTNLNNVSSYSVSSNLGVALLDDGSLTYWGNSGKPTLYPSGLPSIRSAKLISSNTMAVTDSGLAVEWDSSGIINVNTPTFTKPVISISGYNSSRYVVHDDFTVSSWISHSGTPIADTPDLTNVGSIHCSINATFALTRSGEVISWGNSSSNVGSLPENLTAVQELSVNNNLAIALKTDGTLSAWGSNDSLIAELHTLNNVKQAIASISSAFILFEDGTYEQFFEPPYSTATLAPPFSVRGVTSVSSRFEYLDYSGNLTNHGGNSTYYSTPSSAVGALDLAASYRATFILNSDGTVDSYGEFNFDRSNLTSNNFSKVIQIESNFENMAGLTEDGEIILHPNNRYLKAIPPGLEPAIDLAIGGYLSYAIHSDGSLTTIGPISYKVANFTGLKKVSCGWYNAIAIDENDNLLAWPIFQPANTFDLPESIGTCSAVACTIFDAYAVQTGGNLIHIRFDSTPTYTIIQGAENLIQLESCQNSVIGRKSDGSVIVIDGALTTPITALSNIVNVTAGNGHYTALEANGTLHVWGTKFTPIEPHPEEIQFQEVAPGKSHSIGLSLDNKVHAWGADYFGSATPPLNLPPVKQVSAGNGFSLALLQDGTLSSWGDSPPLGYSTPSDLSQIAHISAGSSHAAALHEDDTVTVWGDNTYDQLNKPVDLPAISQISCGENHTLALSKVDGKVFAWGHNDKGQTDVPASLINVQKIIAGKDHSCALLADGSVVAWGYDYYGQTTVPAWIGAVTDISAGAFSDRTFYQFGKDGSDTYNAMISDLSAHGFTGDELSPNASPYGDGTPNLLKWASNVDLDKTSNLTLHSNSNTSGIPLTISEQGAQETTFTFEFLRRKNSSLVYIPEISYDLISYHPANGIESVESIDAEWERVSLEHNLETGDHQQVFGRVKISLP